MNCPHCGKVAFASRGEAEKEAMWMASGHAKKKRGKRFRVRPYQCPHGVGWHLTSQGYR